jgi:alkylhydroperoxidase/carboxymuconolactone decarboxylase family protein YurZ
VAEVKNQLDRSPVDQSAGSPAMTIMARHSTPARRTERMSAMKEFAGLYYREGALDPKTMQLVALAAMAAAGCTS